MNVLHIGPLPGNAHLHLDNEDLDLFREIQVDDPDDVWGAPIYMGIAWKAPEVLTPGTYHYVYTDEEDWGI